MCDYTKKSTGCDSRSIAVNDRDESMMIDQQCYIYTFSTSQVTNLKSNEIGFTDSTITYIFPNIVTSMKDSKPNESEGNNLTTNGSSLFTKKHQNESPFIDTVATNQCVVI